MKTIIENGIIVNEGRAFKGSLIIDGDHIEKVIAGDEAPRGSYDDHVDATGCLIIPGVIDEHVHFREPGLTHKGDIESESRAAAWGGVTTYFEMPNTKPQTTTPEAWQEKMRLAAEKSHVNYAFFYGATKDNVSSFGEMDKTRFPGIKLFMGASTGNMLVDSEDDLDAVFGECAKLGLPLMTHCENTEWINKAMEYAKSKLGKEPDIYFHEYIRSEEECFESSEHAIRLARKHGTRLHVAHISTEKELSLFEVNGNTDKLGPMPQITAEVVLSHLLFSDKLIPTLGSLIKCNPSIKKVRDRNALRRALSNGKLTCVATDHAPHTLSEKQGGCETAASGMPMVQFSLVSMLGLVDWGSLTIERLVWLMCHNPARLFSVSSRGFLREGYKADIVIVRHVEPWTLTEDMIQSKCHWSPLTGSQFKWRVERTICNGHTVYCNGKMDENYRGEAVRFRSDQQV